MEDRTHSLNTNDKQECYYQARNDAGGAANHCNAHSRSRRFWLRLPNADYTRRVISHLNAPQNIRILTLPEDSIWCRTLFRNADCLKRPNVRLNLIQADNYGQSPESTSRSPSALAKSTPAVLRSILIRLPDGVHKVVMADPCHTPCDGCHDGPPVAMSERVRRNPEARKGGAHNQFMIGGFDD